MLKKLKINWFQRLVISIFTVMTVIVTNWFMDLPDGSPAQAGFAGAWAIGFVALAQDYAKNSTRLKQSQVPQ